MVTGSKERDLTPARQTPSATHARFKRYLMNYTREYWRKIRDKDKGLYNVTFLFMFWSAGGSDSGRYNVCFEHCATKDDVS